MRIALIFSGPNVTFRTSLRFIDCPAMTHSFLYSLIDTSGNHFKIGDSAFQAKSIFFDNSVRKSADPKFVNIYSGHELKPENFLPLERNNVSPDWFFPIIIIVLAIFAWLRVAFNKYFFQMIQAFLNSNLANQIVRDENIFIQRASVWLGFVYNLIVSLLLYIVSIHYGWHLGGIGNEFGRFIFFFVIVTGVYALKFLVLKISGWLFGQEREMASYIFNIFLINNILGMALLPFVLIIAYNESVSISWIITIPVILIAIAFGWRIFRGIQIALGSNSFSPLYLFLYLCTLEIAPLLVLIRCVMP
jgi:hypothetical protein